VANIRAGYRHTLGGFEISPYVGINNMFDESYFGNIRINAVGNRYYEPAPDMNVYGGLSIRHTFQ